MAAVGFAAEVSQHVALCGTTWHRGDRGATNDMLVQSLRLQCGAREARAAERGGFELPRLGRLIARSTQLIRAAATGDLQRARRLIQLGANLDLVDSLGYSSLH